MKATKKLELFNYNARAGVQAFNREILSKVVDEELFRIPQGGWIAEITDFDNKFKYNRQFLKGSIDYTHANSAGSRGVYKHYILETGKLYEIKEQVSWKSVVRYFAKVTTDGDIEEITEEELIACLKNLSE